MGRYFAIPTLDPINEATTEEEINLSPGRFKVLSGNYSNWRSFAADNVRRNRRKKTQYNIYVVDQDQLLMYLTTI